MSGGMFMLMQPVFLLMSSIMAPDIEPAGRSAVILRQLIAKPTRAQRRRGCTFYIIFNAFDADP